MMKDVLNFGGVLASRVPVIARHSPHCTQKGMGHSDAAKRISDTVNLHWAAGWDACIGKWIAFRLADGTGGHQLYDRKRDAVRDQSDEMLCLYLKIVPGGMDICEAEILLRTHRQLYDNGFRLHDPDDRYGGKDFIPRVAGEHRARTLRMLRR